MSAFNTTFNKKLGLPDEFPVFFPPMIERFRRTLSAATGTPDEYSIAYLLTAAATALGGNVSACVQSGWCTRANLYLAVVGYKGRGKSTLAEKTIGPLKDHEERLKAAARDNDEFDEEDPDGESDEPRQRRRKPQHDPGFITNDATGPAILSKLREATRQFLVQCDEIYGMLAGGTAIRPILCELYDGRSRSRHRVTDRGESSALQDPYVVLIGTIQPDLLGCLYNSKGDDGMLDRFLPVGRTGLSQPDWPEDADDPALNSAWAAAINRLLNIETLAADAAGGKVRVRFHPDAVNALRVFNDEVNEIVLALRLPEAQYGITSKIRGHAVRLALLHRAVRWAAGEFGDEGPLGDIDEGDALAARDAARFFLARWIAWRPELRPSGNAGNVTPVGLVLDPGDDPALLVLASMADAAQATVRTVERLVRYLRRRGGCASLADMLAAGPMATVPPDTLQEACNWLVEQRQAHWEADGRAIALEPLPTKTSRSRKRIGRQPLVAR